MNRVHRRREAGFSFVELLSPSSSPASSSRRWCRSSWAASTRWRGTSCATPPCSSRRTSSRRSAPSTTISSTQANLDEQHVHGRPVRHLGAVGHRRREHPYVHGRLRRRAPAEGSVEGAETHKQVTVTATWTAPPPPNPPSSAPWCRSSTPGRRSCASRSDPPSILVADGDSYSIVSGPVVLDAYLLPDDILSMNQAADEENRGYVLFTVTSLNGTVVASHQIDRAGERRAGALPGHVGQLRRRRRCLHLPGGRGGGLRLHGPKARRCRSPCGTRTTHRRRRPTCRLSAGDGAVYLTWVTPAIGDLDYYEVWRSTDGRDLREAGRRTGGELHGHGRDQRHDLLLQGPHGRYGGLDQRLHRRRVGASPRSPAIRRHRRARAAHGAGAEQAAHDPPDVGGVDRRRAAPPSGLAGYVIERSPNGSRLDPGREPDTRRWTTTTRTPAGRPRGTTA